MAVRLSLPTSLLSVTMARTSLATSSQRPTTGSPSFTVCERPVATTLLDRRLSTMSRPEPRVGRVTASLNVLTASLNVTVRGE